MVIQGAWVNAMIKTCIVGLTGIPPGRHNIKDPRLDQIHKIVEADKKTYAQIEVVPEEAVIDAEILLATTESFPDLLLKDMEFIETRLGRNPPDAEKAVLVKIQQQLEAGHGLRSTELSPDESSAIAAHGFITAKPIVVARADETPEALMVRAFHESGYISFLTVGGKENRAWPIRKGMSAVEAAGAIHTDLQKGFIRAEVISFDDLVQAGSETEAKRAGKVRLETKAYIMQDYDVVNFRFSK
jgi:ribosome-binding ATPase YchF (GTP1/OBG family)